MYVFTKINVFLRAFRSYATDKINVALQKPKGYHDREIHCITTNVDEFQYYFINKKKKVKQIFFKS